MPKDAEILILISCPVQGYPACLLPPGGTLERLLLATKRKPGKNEEPQRTPIVLPGVLGCTLARLAWNSCVALGLLLPPAGRGIAGQCTNRLSVASGGFQKGAGAA